MGIWEPARQHSLEDKKPDRPVGFSSVKSRNTQSRSARVSGGAVASGRLTSLDAFRGLTIALMIMVNSSSITANAFGPLTHADWHGWTFADAVFPSFLFIVGVSLVFSFAKREEGYPSTWPVVIRISRRAIILFVLGLLVNMFPSFDLSTIRIPGVLQRIAICYFFASLIVLKTGLRGTVLLLFILLASYWVMMQYIPVPGIGAGVLEPGKNFSAWVDSLVLRGYMWSYYDGEWDPEGIVSTIPSIATTLFGVLTGLWLKSSAKDRRKVAGMLCAGLVLIVAGQVLDRWMPINKGIWTSTFSIFMAGLALLCLAFFHLLIDIAKLSRWAKPFIILGLNPIAIYVLSIVMDTTLRATDFAVSSPTASGNKFCLLKILCAKTSIPEIPSFLYALMILTSMFIVAWILWRRRIFIKV